MKRKIVSLWTVGIMLFTAISFGGCALWGEAGDPQGIATTSVAICEILDALGCDEVVGVPSTSGELPARYADVRTIGAPMQPQMEILKQINPEVVLVPTTLEASLASEFSAAGIAVKYINLSDIDGMYGDIAELGTLLGKEAQAQALCKEYADYMDAYPKTETEITVMTVMAFPSLFTIATEDSYVGDLVKLAGGKTSTARDTSRTGRASSPTTAWKTWRKRIRISFLFLPISARNTPLRTSRNSPRRTPSGRTSAPCKTGMFTIFPPKTASGSAPISAGRRPSKRSNRSFSGSKVWGAFQKQKAAAGRG